VREKRKTTNCTCSAKEACIYLHIHGKSISLEKIAHLSLSVICIGMEIVILNYLNLDIDSSLCSIYILMYNFNICVLHIHIIYV